MGKEDDLEEILLNDASNIAFEREKYEKETYEINLGIKGLSARALTSFDRQKLEMLEDLAKKKQLLNAREERYFDSLNEFRSNLRLSDMKEQELVKRNSSSIPAPKKTSTIYYLVEERDAILLEKKRIRSELNRLLENEEIGPQAGRSNLLRNSEGPKLHLGKQVTGPSDAEIFESKLKKTNEHFEVVHNIERIRNGANNMGNSNKEFLHSLQSVLHDLRNDYFQDDKHAGTRVGDSPDNSQRNTKNGRGDDSQEDDDDKDNRKSEFDGTRDSGFSRATNNGRDYPGSHRTNTSKRNAGKNGPMGQMDPYFDMEGEPLDKLTKKKIQLMNIEKALGFEERIQEMNLQREKMELDLLTTNAQMRYQDFILQHYQEIMHEKDLLKRDMVSEMENIRKDRTAARNAMLEVRNAREELEVERKKAFMDRRAKELQHTKKEMVNIVKNYLDYKSYADDKSPFPAEININKFSTNLGTDSRHRRRRDSDGDD